MLFFLCEKKILSSPPDCEPLTFSRWNMVEPGQFTADTHRSGSMPNRYVLLWFLSISTFLTVLTE